MLGSGVYQRFTSGPMDTFSPFINLDRPNYHPFGRTLPEKTRDQRL